MGVLDAPGVRKTTKRVTLRIGGEGLVSNTWAATTGFDAVNRPVVILPVPKTTRWRLKYIMYNALTNVAGGGGLTLTGVWNGAPLLGDGVRTDGRPSCKYVAAPSQVLDGATLPASGTDYVSAWVTDGAQQFNPYKPSMPSVGLHSGGAAFTGFYDLKNSWFFGAGAAAAAGAVGYPAGLVQGSFCGGDLRLEYEFVDEGRTPVVLFLGNSICSGTSGLTNASIYAHEAWPGVAGLLNGCAWINMGVGSSKTSDWTANNDWKWNAFDLATTIPDLAIIAINGNDAVIAPTLTVAQAQANTTTIVANLRARGIPNIAFATEIPRGFGGLSFAESFRNTMNNWARSMPLGAVACYDLDRAVMRRGTIVKTDATLTAGAGGNPVTVNSVGNGINVGATVSATGTGTLAALTQVTAVSGTSVTLNNNPTGSGAATLTFVNPNNDTDPDYLPNGQANPHPLAGGHQAMGNVIHFRRGT